MNRKEFLGGTLACCGAALVLGRATARASEEGPACERQLEFTKAWVADLLVQMDEKLPREMRERVMEANGRACYVGAHGETATPGEPVDIDGWVAGLAKHVGKENAWREGDRIHFRYVANPAGLRVADGYCLCPLFEDGPRTLSPTYCHCSVGYVTQIFRALGRPVHVDLVESLRRGGRACHFVATLRV